MSDIFISYSRIDKHWVATLAKALQVQGYNVWWDPEILLGQDFEAVIQAALENTGCVVTVWSQASIKSHWVKEESSIGLNRGVLIPILYQQVKPPMPFGRIHTDDLQDWKGDVEDASFQLLLWGIALHCKPSLVKTSISKNQSSETDEVSTKDQPIKKQQAKQRTIAGRYINHGNGTVSDSKTGLMWKKCCEGQVTLRYNERYLSILLKNWGLSGDDCSQGKAARYTWDDAMEKFKNNHFAGYDDWRLPTLEELRTLVYRSNGANRREEYQRPTINQQAFPNTEATGVWSSSPAAHREAPPVAIFASNAWMVNFDGGNDYRGNEGLALQVRLVRSGQ